MVAPLIVPTGYQNNYTDYLQTKVERDGSVRRLQGTVTIPDATTADSIIGLFPFNAGMSFAGLSGYNFHVTDLDTASSVTFDVGVVYQDTAAGVDDLDLIASASTAAQAGGYIAPDEQEWMTYVTTGNGWVVVQTNTLTTEAGTVTFNVPTTYDQPVS